MTFLLELASEEIPARMQVAAAEQLRARFVDGCKAAGLGHGSVVADVTPRRLWLIADDVEPASAATREERKGPAATAPEAAIAGFLRSTGLTRDALEERATPKGVVLFAHIETPGRDAAAILADLVPAIVAGFQWPKSMRWGAASAVAGSPRWVRPLTGIVALLDGKVVACEAHGIAAGRVTRGHRIHAPGEIDIASAETYLLQLRGARVIASSAERRAIIETNAATVALTHGLTVIPDAGLVAENAGLTEWPVPMLGHFDPAFLSVPREVIQLTMRTNQKYFALADQDGALAPAFVCVANLVANDGGAAIIAGNERVLSARLSDAKFFWDQDVATVKAGGLEAFLPKLGDIVFHEKLGTVADKVERVAKLARWLVESGAVNGDADLAEQAARLCKADLVSATVGEFPEVQGTAGAYLARVAGLDPQVADAIRDHYKPVGQADDVPTAPVSVAVALADKLDTLGRFFSEELYPTSSKDPFALRRAALGVLRIIISSNSDLDVFEAVQIGLFGRVLDLGEQTSSLVWRRIYLLDGFFKDRFEQMLRDEGVEPGVVRAVLDEGNIGFRPRPAVAAARAFATFLGTESGINLLSGVKRASNILRIEEAKSEACTAEANPALFTDPAETALSVALDVAVPAIADAVAREDFASAMIAVAELRPAVDAFFDTVIVNASEPLLRANRLGLLARLRAAANSVADFSRIEG